MTLFDTLRYPISDRITLEELEAVPRPIYDHWNEAYGYRAQVPRLLVHSFLISGGKEEREMIAHLRRLIAEYEPL